MTTIPGKRTKCASCNKRAITILHLGIGDMPLCKTHLKAHQNVLSRNLTPGLRSQIGPRKD